MQRAQRLYAIKKTAIKHGMKQKLTGQPIPDVRFLHSQSPERQDATSTSSQTGCPAAFPICGQIDHLSRSVAHAVASTLKPSYDAMIPAVNILSDSGAGSCRLMQQNCPVEWGRADSRCARPAAGDD